MQAPTRTLILGDESFTFSNCILEARSRNASGVILTHNEIVDVACCLPLDQMKEEYAENAQALRSKGIFVLFDVNPALLRNDIECNSYDRVIYVLPAVCFSGCPSFINHSSEMFRLRIHLYVFGFLKSSKACVKTGGHVQIVWPRIKKPDDDPALPRAPFADIEPNKLARFCKIARDAADDKLLDIRDVSVYDSWIPIIHGQPMIPLPDYLRVLKLYTFTVDQDTKLHDSGSSFGSSGPRSLAYNSGKPGREKKNRNDRNVDLVSIAAEEEKWEPSIATNLDFPEEADFGCVLENGPETTDRFNDTFQEPKPYDNTYHHSDEYYSGGFLTDNLHEISWAKEYAPLDSLLTAKKPRLYQNEVPHGASIPSDVDADLARLNYEFPVRGDDEVFTSHEDYNVLRVPPEIFDFSRQQLPHVNECFKFYLLNKSDILVQVSKLTLKYDPRISGWRGDGSPIKTKAVGGKSGGKQKGEGKGGGGRRNESHDGNQQSSDTGYNLKRQVVNDGGRRLCFDNKRDDNNFEDTEFSVAGNSDLFFCKAMNTGWLDTKCKEGWVEGVDFRCRGGCIIYKSPSAYSTNYCGVDKVKNQFLQNFGDGRRKLAFFPNENAQPYFLNNQFNYNPMVQHYPINNDLPTKRMSHQYKSNQGMFLNNFQKIVPKNSSGMISGMNNEPNFMFYETFPFHQNKLRFNDRYASRPPIPPPNKSIPNTYYNSEQHVIVNQEPFKNQNSKPNRRTRSYVNRNFENNGDRQMKDTFHRYNSRRHRPSTTSQQEERSLEAVEKKKHPEVALHLSEQS